MTVKKPYRKKDLTIMAKKKLVERKKINLFLDEKLWDSFIEACLAKVKRKPSPRDRKYSVQPNAALEMAIRQTLIMDGVGKPSRDHLVIAEMARDTMSEFIVASKSIKGSDQVDVLNTIVKNFINYMKGKRNGNKRN